VRRAWHSVADAVSWTPPTSTELGTVVKAAVAAGLAWALAVAVTDSDAAVLAALTSVVVVQVNVRASVPTALQRSAAVVIGVLTALAIGDALSLNALTVGLLVGGCLALAQLVFRLPPAAARQVPVTMLVVLTAAAADPDELGWQRAAGTLIGAAVGDPTGAMQPPSPVVGIAGEGHAGAGLHRGDPIGPRQNVRHEIGAVAVADHLTERAAALMRDDDRHTRHRRAGFVDDAALHGGGLTLGGG